MTFKEYAENCSPHFVKLRKLWPFCFTVLNLFHRIYFCTKLYFLSTARKLKWRETRFSHAVQKCAKIKPLAKFGESKVYIYIKRLFTGLRIILVASYARRKLK